MGDHVKDACHAGPDRRRYAALRLNSFGAARWAVIVLGSGAIATDESNRLLMRLTEAEANRIAAEMTKEAAEQ